MKVKTLAIAGAFELVAVAVSAAVALLDLAYFSSVFIAFNVFGLALAVLMTPRLPRRSRRFD